MPRRKFYSFYVRAAIDRDTMEWTTKFPRSNHAHVYFFIFPWLALYVALVYLIHRWPMLEMMRKTLSLAILVAMHKGFSGQRMRMRKAGPCKAQILETRVDFLETRSELFQKQVR